MMPRRLIRSSLLALSLAAHALAGGTINVPADQPTIQLGIAAAMPGDEVVIAPGTYFEHIDLMGKAITVRSIAPSNDAVVDATILDGMFSGTVVSCVSGEGLSTVLDGLTIRRGLAPDGGGALIRASSPTVMRCVFTDNAALRGGGIFVENDSNPRLDSCVFLANAAFDDNGLLGEGGGFHADHDSSPSLTDCVFLANYAFSKGGGLFAGDGSLPAMLRCDFVANTTELRDGGGVAVLQHPGLLRVQNCEFLNNTSGGAGGGFSVEGELPVEFTDCVFSDNLGQRGGALFYDCDGALDCINTDFNRNRVDEAQGGAIYVVTLPGDTGGPISVRGCKFVENEAHIVGGAIFAPFSRRTTARDCQFLDNTSPNQAGVILAYGSELADCLFRGNESRDGACIIIGHPALGETPGSQTVIRDCRFVQNTGFFGSGVGSVYGRCSITDSVFAENASGIGTSAQFAALELLGPPNGTGVVERCVFRENEGGAVALEAPSPPYPTYSFVHCEFIENSSPNAGGAIWTDQARVELSNSLLAGNSASDGGAIFHRRSRVRVISSTIAENSADPGGGIITGQMAAARLDVLGSIVWGNGPNEPIRLTEGSRATAEYSLIEGGYEGPGVIDADPMFADPTGSGGEGADFSLLSGSPAIDAGDNEAPIGNLATDLDGNPRFIDDPYTPDTGLGTLPVIDIGALEYQNTTGTCAGDCNLSGAVEFDDLVVMLFEFGPGAGPCDADGSGEIEFNDLVSALFLFGPCP